MLLAPDTWHNPCGVAYRWSTDGRFELDGIGFPSWDAGSAHGAQLAKIWTDWGSVAQAAADKYGIPASWLIALIKIETGGNAKLCSPAGACGLMQFTPVACKMYGHSDCSYYNDHMDEQVFDAADLLLKKASSWGGCILSGVKGYNGGSPCKQAGGINGNNPGILGMYGENNYVESFVRAANTFAALGLAPASPLDGGRTSTVVSGIVVAGILGAITYMFADIHWGLSDRIARAVGLDRWNA